MNIYTHFALLTCGTLLLTACANNDAPKPVATTNSTNPAKTTEAASTSDGKTVSVKTIVMKRDDGKGEPGTEVKNFNTSDRVWHFEVGLDRIVTNSKIKMDFIGVNTSTGKDKKLGAVEGKLLIANNLTFKVPLTGKMAVGQYRGDVYVGEDVIKRVDFTVEPEQTGEISITAVRLLGDDGKGAARAEVKEFKSNQRKQFFEADTKGANVKPTQVKWVITALGSPNNTKITEISDERIIEDTILTGNLELQRDFPAGQYQVEIFLNDKLAKRFTYEVKTEAAALVFAELKPYGASNKMVEVAVPKDWEVTDKSSAEEAQIDFYHPKSEAYMAVYGFKAERKPDAAFVKNQLDKFVDNVYKDEKGYAGKAAEPRNDIAGSVAAEKTFTLNVTTSSGKIYKYGGLAIARHDNGVMSIRRILITPEALAANPGVLQKMIDSYKVAAPAPAEAKPLTIGKLTTYKHKSGVFQIDVPSDWKVTDQSKTGTVLVNFVEPNQRALIVVEAFSTKDKSTSDVLKKALETYVNKGYGDMPNFKADNPKAEGENSAGMTFVFDLVSNGKTTKMVGAVYIDRTANTISYLRSVLPLAEAGNVEKLFDTIGNSFKVNGAAKI